MRGQNHLHANFGLTTWVGKRLRPAPQQTACDGKQEKFIGALFTGRLHMDEFAQLDSLRTASPLRAHNLTLSMAHLLERLG